MARRLVMPEPGARVTCLESPATARIARFRRAVSMARCLARDCFDWVDAGDPPPPPQPARTMAARTAALPRRPLLTMEFSLFGPCGPLRHETRENRVKEGNLEAVYLLIYRTSAVSHSD